MMGVNYAWGETVLFYKNGANMSSAYAYFYDGSYWDDSNGAGSYNIPSCCNQMAFLGYDTDNKGIYVFQNSNTYSYVAIMQDSQSGYENFSSTCGCAATYDKCDGLYSISTPMMISTSSNSFTKNGGTVTYYHFSWGTPTVWLKHANWDGSNWGWKQMTYNTSNGTFTLDANYTNGSGCNYGCKSGNEQTLSRRST